MTQLIHNLQGNTKIMKNVRQVTKTVNPKNHAVWTLPLLYDLLKQYFYEFYDNQEHSALGESPRQAFERGISLSGNRPFRLIPYDTNFKILTLPPIKTNNGTAKVDAQRGIKIKYFYYYCPEFSRAELSQTRVQVRYDPSNIGIVYCYVNKKWTECRSQYFSILNRRTEKEVELASQELFKQKSEHTRKSAISARELAHFLMEAEATEEILMQQMRDMEVAPQLKLITGIDNPVDLEKGDPYKNTFDKKFNFDMKNY
jgi:hypothetical protein